jgi:hypothetical protein
MKKLIVLVFYILLATNFTVFAQHACNFNHVKEAYKVYKYKKMYLIQTQAKLYLEQGIFFDKPPLFYMLDSLQSDSLGNFYVGRISKMELQNKNDSQIWVLKFNNQQNKTINFEICTEKEFTKWNTAHLLNINTAWEKINRENLNLLDLKAKDNLLAQNLLKDMNIYFAHPLTFSQYDFYESLMNFERKLINILK